MVVREYRADDIHEMMNIWNEVVEEGVAFPQVEALVFETAKEFFASQSYTAVAEEDGKVYGLYDFGIGVYGV